MSKLSSLAHDDDLIVGKLQTKLMQKTFLISNKIKQCVNIEYIQRKVIVTNNHYNGDEFIPFHTQTILSIRVHWNKSLLSCRLVVHSQFPFWYFRLVKHWLQLCS